MSYLTCTGLGRLGKDAELRFSKNGTPILSFTIATDEAKKELDVNYQPKRTETAWIECTYFGSDAERLVELLLKGTLVDVMGDLVPSTWETPEGEKKTKLKLKVRAIRAIAKKTDAVGTKAIAQPDPWAKPVDDVDVSNVPF